jgi:hypothetical protein
MAGGIQAKASILAAFMCGCVLGAWAQGGTRSVEGIVYQADEQPAAGAAVQLKNLKTLQVRSFIADKSGAYQFHGLSRDVDYELKAQHEGRWSESKTLSALDSRAKAVIHLKMPSK